jgi:acyl-CoA thioesterase-2
MRGVPANLDELIDLLDLEPVEETLFRGQQPTTTLQRVYGGQVLAQALMAAARTVDPGRAPHSLHAYFLRPGDISVPIVYDVDRVRDGHSFSTRRVVARQHSRTIFHLSASFQVPEPGLDHQDEMPTDLPDPEDCPSLGTVLGGRPGLQINWDEEWAALELRHVADSSGASGWSQPGHPAVNRAWLRVAGTMPDDPLLHACVLAYASDHTLLRVSLTPHGRDPRLREAVDMHMASLDHAMWFHRPFRADEWLLYDQVSPSASGARGLALGRLFTRDGRLVATVAQEGLIRPIGRRPS